MTRPLKNPAQYHCQAVGCQHQVQRGHLMCLPHWRMVPKALADGVRAAWLAQRRSNSADALKAYMQARGLAIEAVAAKQRARLAAAEASTPPLF